MSRQQIDDYLARLEEPKRSTLEALRRDILLIRPDAEECLSYGVPGFRVDGVVVAGFAAARHHLSYFPHSGSVLDQLADELSGYDSSKGTLRFPIDRPLPQAIVEKLIVAKTAVAEGDEPRSRG